MALTKFEKAYLKELVKRELEHFKREEKTMFVDVALPFLKGAHEYGHFLENLIKKL